MYKSAGIKKGPREGDDREDGEVKGKERRSEEKKGEPSARLR